MQNKKTINVLHIIDKLSMDGVNPSSCAILLNDWFTCLNPKMFKMTVCTLRNPDPAGELLERSGARVNYLGFGKYSVKNIQEISRLAEKNHVDLLHLHGYSASNFGRIVSRKYGIKNIVHEHAVLRTLPHQYLADFFLRKSTDSAIATSEYVREFMIKSRSIPADRIKVIWNGINLAKFKKKDYNSIERKRNELRISEKVRVIGTVGRLREEKGTEYLIKAIPIILKEVSNVHFLVVGDGPLRSELEYLAKNLNLNEKVSFLGYRKDVVELLSVLDINVIPSCTEGAPLCLIEAMAIGNSIVATEVGGMREIGIDGENLIFVPPKNPQKIADKILLLLSNQSFLEKIGNNAKKLSEELSIEKGTQLIEDLYVRMVNSP